jgi:DNA mismatch repair ATPase MutL
MEFRISSELKNIIGQDLIVNDQVAIFELVKNSYDAHATRVDIVFEEDKITIKDNGKGITQRNNSVFF